MEPNVVTPEPPRPLTLLRDAADAPSHRRSAETRQFERALAGYLRRNRSNGKQRKETPTVLNDTMNSKDENAITRTTDDAGSGTEGVKETIVDVKDQAQGFLAKEFRSRVADVSGQLGSAGKAVSEAAAKLREEGNGPAAEITDRVASKLEAVSGYLETTEPSTLLRDLEDFGRKQTAVMVVGGLLLGLAGSRFLKASSTRRQEMTDEWGGPAPRPTQGR
jgi:hypothetical protein